MIYNRIMEKEKTCQSCTSTRGLIVHHKDQNRNNNLPANRITLCPRCHQETHYGTLKRNMEIRFMRNEGKAIQEITDLYRLSRQRIHQITKGNPKII